MKHASAAVSQHASHRTASPVAAGSFSAGWWLLPSVVVAMLVSVIAWAGMSGASFAEQMGSMWALPWGVAVIVDVYAGLILAGAWIAWREASLLRASPWWLALALGGNLATCAYVLLALRASRGSVQTLFTGSR